MGVGGVWRDGRKGNRRMHPLALYVILYVFTFKYVTDDYVKMEKCHTTGEDKKTTPEKQKDYNMMTVI